MRRRIKDESIAPIEDQLPAQLLLSFYAIKNIPGWTAWAPVSLMALMMLGMLRYDWEVGAGPYQVQNHSLEGMVAMGVVSVRLRSGCKS